MMSFAMDVIRRFFSWFWGKILRRTGYSALIDGKIITGCGLGCDFNKEMRMQPFYPSAHYCTASVKENGDFNTIYDPYDIPEFCPYRMTISKV